MTIHNPTQICISVDTEFSIAGHFDNPEKNQPVAEPMVYGTVNGREEALGFMLETFARCDIRASFFVECANHFYFGDEPMRTVVNRLKAAGQDIQLHVHPVWCSFNRNASPGAFPRNDSCAGRDFEELKRIFLSCIEVFQAWVGHKPLAVRTGSLLADETVYRVLGDLGIPMSSSIALGVFQPEEAMLCHHSGRHRIHGVMEIPVFTYRDMNVAGREHNKSLQITSCSWPEMKYLLWKARRAGIENIVILTHPFEYIKKADARYTRLTRNRVNQQRLLRLCEFVQDNPRDFVATDFSSQHQAWAGSELNQAFLTVPSVYAIGRKLHNALNDMLWRY